MQSHRPRAVAEESVVRDAHLRCTQKELEQRSTARTDRKHASCRLGSAHVTNAARGLAADADAHTDPQHVVAHLDAVGYEARVRIAREGRQAALDGDVVCNGYAYKSSELSELRCREVAIDGDAVWSSVHGRIARRAVADADVAPLDQCAARGVYLEERRGGSERACPRTEGCAYQDMCAVGRAHQCHQCWVRTAARE